MINAAKLTSSAKSFDIRLHYCLFVVVLRGGEGARGTQGRDREKALMGRARGTQRKREALMGRARGTQGRGGRLTGVGYVVSRKEVINVYRVSTTAYEFSSTGKCFKFALEIIVTPTAKRFLAAIAVAGC